MLPGIRFLFTAVVLSMSILVFGLGAAAWLRSAHERFASLPSRLTPAEPAFAQQHEAPTLALLRFDPPTAEKAPDVAPAADEREVDTPPAPVSDAAPDATSQTAALPQQEPAVVEPEPALKLEAPTQAETRKPEPQLPAAETATAAPAAPAETIAPVARTEAPAVQEQAKVAAIAEPPAAAATAPAVNEPAAPPAPATAPTTGMLSLEGNIAATKIATLGGPPVKIDEGAKANATDAKPDRSVVRKRAAQRARERQRRRNAARRARLARQAAAAAAQQQQANPFGQPPIVRGAR